MDEPVVIATWSFGAIANAAAFPLLDAGGSCLDAVEAGCCAVEADEKVASVGRGGLPDETGEVSLDGCIMTSPARRGAVCFVRRYMHVVSIARRVMEKTRHILLAGEGAEDFAAREGFTPTALLTDVARAKYETWKAAHPTGDYVTPANIEENHDTVCVLARDRAGRLAGACSTSGLAYKMHGRVGDSPIIGHGLYVHPKFGAAAATGTGELVMGVCGSYAIVDAMRRGASPLQAIVESLQRIRDEYALREEHQVGFMAMTPAGECASGCLRRGFTMAVTTSAGAVQREPDTILLT
ncbi:MAG: glycosylasparaginase [Planctomycetes bacterium]|nr:glycosylasparaginase [Planctomycetota bacterium]